MTVDDQSMQTLWKLTNDLTAQLVFNRNATLELKQQLADLKAKAASGSITLPDNGSTSHHSPHHSTSQQHVEESLRIANERLTEENVQLQDQLREYERWIEYIMTKFRLQNFAMVHSRKEVMQEAYKIIEQERDLNNQLRLENAALQQRLVQVGSIARRAINDEYYKTETLVDMLMVENQGLREMLGVAEASGNIEHNNIMEGRQPGYRVSFPSTGSYNGSSEGDEMDVGGTRLCTGAEQDATTEDQPMEDSATITSASSRILNDGAPLSQPPRPLDTIPQPSSQEAEQNGCQLDGDKPNSHGKESEALRSEQDHDTVIEDHLSHSDSMDEAQGCQDQDQSDLIRSGSISPGYHTDETVASAPEHQDQRQEDSESGVSDAQQHSSKAGAQSNQLLSPGSPMPLSPSTSAAVSSISINTDVGGVVTTPKRTNKPRKKRAK